MAQNARSHRKLKIAGIVALVVVVALLGFAGNFLFDFALNPRAPYTMKMMQDSKNDKEGEQPDAEDTEARAWFKENRESSNLTADDGTELAAWYFAASESTHDYAVCLHGYTNEPIGMARYVKRFHDRGMNVLAPAARAHERSGGDYIGMGWPERLDVVAWIERVVQADPEARILVFGESMGAATAMNVAGESLPANVKCIIEDCGYTSVWDEFSLQLKNVFGLPSFPLLDVANLVCNVRAGYDFHKASSVEQLKHATVPMLFIHGDQDTFVPYDMLDQNYDACASKVKQKLTIHGATHAKSAQVDPELYWNTVNNFLTSSASGVESKLYEQVKYFYTVNAWLPRNATVVNQKAFDALDKPTQEAVMKAAAAAEKRGRETSERLDKEYLKELAAKGMVIAEPSAALKAEFAKIGDTMTEEWIKNAGADGKAIVDAYRKR